MKSILILAAIIAASCISTSIPTPAEALPPCRASTCSGAQQNCTNYRQEHGISTSALPCENYGARCMATGVFPGNKYSPFPNGCTALRQ
jgi:hypothetical protein